MKHASRREFVALLTLGWVSSASGALPMGQSPVAVDYSPLEADTDDSGPPDLGASWYRIDSFPCSRKTNDFKTVVESYLGKNTLELRQLRSEYDKLEGIECGYRTTKREIKVISNWIIFSRESSEYVQYKILWRRKSLSDGEVIVLVRNGRRDVVGGEIQFPGQTPTVTKLTKALGEELRRALGAQA